MSEQIDWSKAPEGATHWEPKTANVIAGWIRLDGDKWFFWPISTRDTSDIRWHKCVNDMSVRSEYMIQRQTTPSWSGEGLPPVGVVCEVIDGLSNEFTKQFNGKQVEIVAHSKDENYETAVFKVIGFLYDGQARYHSLVASCFKPIRTHEQIAADEREAAIKNMASTPKPCGHAIYDICAQLYDAGYRKP